MGAAPPRGAPASPETVTSGCLPLLTVLAFSAPLLANDALTPPPEAGDATALFNGKDLTGRDGDPKL